MSRWVRVTWWLARCVDCSSPPVTVPFRNVEERDKWAGEHARATGHRVQHGMEERRTRTPRHPPYMVDERSD